MNRIDRDLRKIMADGTEKYVNPFTGTEVWHIPGRNHRPIDNLKIDEPLPIEPQSPPKHCDFCEGLYFNTTPEKSRWEFRNNQYEFVESAEPGHILAVPAEFRRIANLFPIVTIDYWRKNYHYELSDFDKKRKEHYMSSEIGQNHVLHMVNERLKCAGMSVDDIKNMSLDAKFDIADAFFGSGHDLIIPRHHYKRDASHTNELFSSGEMTSEEHYLYFKYAIQTLTEIAQNNRYCRYVSVFQNWRREAGASFDHLHKQLVALDEWGVSVENELEIAASNPNMYNEYAVNFAGYNNFVLCENDHAIAFVDIGHRYPTIAIYSKSVNCHPAKHTDDEVRAFSDIVHAIHAASGSEIPINEEWYYKPHDSVIPIPWHVLIKWRINVSAGFEGGTKIYVNPMSIAELRDYLVPRLYALRYEDKIAGFQIAEECPCKPNSLQYYKNRLL